MGRVESEDEEGTGGDLGPEELPIVVGGIDTKRDSLNKGNLRQPISFPIVTLGDVGETQC